MKKIFLAMMAAIAALSPLQAQLLQQGEMALVYYAPKNYVVLDFEYTINTYEAGPYARYASSLLGMNETIHETRTEYTLDNVRMSTRTVADTHRAHKVLPEAEFPTQLLTIDRNGLLVGYNLPYEQQAEKSKPATNRANNEQAPTLSLPLTEDQLGIRGEEARAKAIAKQIFRLRDTRMYLLSGELEHTPADGAAMKLVLNELQQEEERLLALFAGSHKTRKEHKRVEYLPTEQGDSQREVLFFSPENGFTSPENVDADTVVIKMTAHRQEVQPVIINSKKKKADKNAPQPSQLIYNLPGQVDIKVTYVGKIMNERTLPIAQYGIDVPLARSLFTGATLPIIRFDTRTGNVQSIQQ